MNDWFFEKFSDRGEAVEFKPDWVVVALWLLLSLGIAALVIFGILEVTTLYLEATR